MLLSIISSLVFTNKRKAMQLIVPESVQKLWNLWELRGLVLTSLGLQIILILIGNRRRQSTSNELRLILWLAYLSADSVATVSLGVLSKNQEDTKADSHHPNNFLITAFWAPFLLLHLGGPDTITAYSLEDNELWLRHLLGLVVQVSVAFYVFFKSWSSEVMNFLAMPMFMVGIIKYGERTWVLRSASNERFRDSMLEDPDPGPNYARYMEEYSSKRAEGFRVNIGTFMDEASKDDGNHVPQSPAIHDGVVNGSHASHAYNFSETFKRLCADLILSFHDIENIQTFFQDGSFVKAFRVMELELEIIYDIFFTKAVLVHSVVGSILRCITLSSTVSVFVAFLFIKKEAYESIDVIITYTMLVGAIALEIYALVLMLSSDRTLLWLCKHKNRVVGLSLLLHKAVSSISLVKGKCWSGSLGQYNLITFCLKGRPTKCICVQKVLFIHRLVEKYRYKDLEVTTPELKNLIFKQLNKKSGIILKKKKEKSRIAAVATNFEVCRELCARRGDWVLEGFDCKDELICWSIKGVEFDQSILLWHIATDLCYNSDLKANFALRRPRRSNINPNLFIRSNSFPGQFAKDSKLLSNYVVYLLVMCPFMLPNGIGQIRFRDTCAEAEEFFKERERVIQKDENEACTNLYDVCTDILPSKVKGDKSKSVLFDACRLAKALQSLETGENWENNKKWDLISNVWVEMLSYAANRCRWSDHAQQLRRGGELLTHVWLLMAHLGLTEQFQISEGYVRAKLIVQ